MGQSLVVGSTDDLASGCVGPSYERIKTQKSERGGAAPLGAKSTVKFDESVTIVVARITC
jgi:hypothetical protein